MLVGSTDNSIDLIEQSNKAFSRQDWLNGEKINHAILLAMRGNRKISHKELVEIARRYLGSIFGQGLFLFDENHPDRIEFERKVQRFRIFIQTNHGWQTSLEGIERDLHEVQLFLRIFRADARNKASNSLRRLGRPDLSVKLCDHLLSNSKLNYYVLTSRSWAYGDLGQIDKALDDAKIALKYEPKGNNYSQIALSRAYRQRFKRDGDLDDAEAAIKWAREALIAKRNFYAASQLVASLRATGQNSWDIEIQKLENEFPQIIRRADEVAIEGAIGIILDSHLVEEDFEDVEDYSDDNKNEIPDELPEDYYEEYFPDHTESLNNPRSPHLEP